MKSRSAFLLLTLVAAALAQQKPGLPLPDPGNVTLPLDAYNHLVDLAAKSAKTPEAPPLPFAIQRAAVRVQVTGESASGTMQFEGETFAKGIVKVPLISGVTLLDAQQKGRELPIEQDGGTCTAALPGPAEFSITLGVGLPLSIDAGRAALNLPAPAAGAVRLTLVIPGDHTNVNLKPGLITGRTSEGGETTIEAALVPGQPASLWWATRESAAPQAPREVRFLSDVKTLVSVSEAALEIATLADITVVQGEPAQFEIEIPPGYEVTGATGASLQSSETQSGVLILKVGAATQRSHQFLISLERAIDAASADVPFLSFKGAQRETGEVLVEGAGAMELTATESGGLKRMDVREASSYLRALAHYPPQAAFRYHKQSAEPPSLALKWVRFPDSSMLAAVAQRATVTTLVTSEGRSLTEVKLVLSNHAQPFLKVALPSGASILSADVAGEKVKPVEGADGSRVPLLRPGFRPEDSYTVSFVFVHSGAPFAKKGDAELVLPTMDLPVGLLEWEVFLPERYKVADFGGDAISASLFPFAPPEGSPAVGRNEDLSQLLTGQVGGYVQDPTGAFVPGAQVTVLHIPTGLTRTAVADQAGRWLVSEVPSGRIKVTAVSPGFNLNSQELRYDASRPMRLSSSLQIGSVAESIEVEGRPLSASEAQNLDREAKQSTAQAANAASTNVFSLQRRVAGVLPIAMDVPRAGNSFRFMRPLVIGEETKVSFRYKTR